MQAVRDGEPASYVDITAMPDALAMTADNVQKVPVLLAVVTRNGADTEPRQTVLRIKAMQGEDELGTIVTTGMVSAYTLSLPSTEWGSADGILVEAFAGTSFSQPLATRRLAIIRDNPQWFPRDDEWNAANTYKNGELLLMDGVVYAWIYPVPGNSTLTPPEDIRQNPDSTHWKAYQKWPLLCTGMLLADFAKMGQAVFGRNYTISQQGTGEGDYRDFNLETGEGSFKPNIVIDWVKGLFRAVNAEISGIIKATEGNIGKFLINEDGLGVSDAEGNEVNITPMEIFLKRVVKYFIWELARSEIRIGGSATSQSDAKAMTAVDIYRNAANTEEENYYVPAVRIESDNAAVYNVGLRVDGGSIIAEQGVLERVRSFDTRTEGNRLRIDKGGCSMVYNINNNAIYLPTRKELCRVFGKNYQTDWVTTRITVASHRGSPQSFKLYFPDDDPGTFYNHNGDTFTPDLSKGDAFEFFLVSEPTTYWALEVNANE